MKEQFIPNLYFGGFISLVRKSKELAIRSRWNSGQISETIKIITAGFITYVNSTDEEITDSNSDSAFSSDDNYIKTKEEFISHLLTF